MFSPWHVLFIGSLIQLLMLFFCGWRRWERLEDTQHSLFIGRWAQNLSLEILNKVSLPLFLVPVLFFFDGRQKTLSASEEFTFNVPHFLFTMLFLDFVFYWRHRLYHLWLQKWHRVHHNDSDYDISVTLRFHPLENLINYFILFLGIHYLQIPVWEAVFIIQVFAFQAFFSHLSDFQSEHHSIGFWNRVFILPRIHRTHHEAKMRPGICFGFVFSFWDQLFGTFTSPTKPSKI